MPIIVRVPIPQNSLGMAANARQTCDGMCVPTTALWGRKLLHLTVAYFLTNLVYPFFTSNWYKHYIERMPPKPSFSLLDRKEG